MHTQNVKPKSKQTQQGDWSDSESASVIWEGQTYAEKERKRNNDKTDLLLCGEKNLERGKSRRPKTLISFYSVCTSDVIASRLPVQ